MKFFTTLINGLKTWTLAQIRKVRSEIDVTVSKAVDESVLTVTFTDSNGELSTSGEGQVSFDKSFNELIAAKDAGRRIEGVLRLEGYLFNLLLCGDIKNGNSRELVFLTRNDGGYLLTIRVSSASGANAKIDYTSKITVGTAELTPGESTLANGVIYLRYEED